MSKTAYIAGKISGLPRDVVQQKFNLIADQLSTLGYDVVGPVSALDDSQPWGANVRSEIKKMMECDEVHMLPDWQDSIGARLERDIALRLGIHIVYH